MLTKRSWSYCSNDRLLLVKVAALGVVHSSEKPSAQQLYEWRALHRPKLQRRVLLQVQTGGRSRACVA